MSYRRKNMIFYEKNIKLEKNDIFNNVFYNRIFPHYRFYQFFKNDWILYNYEYIYI